MSAEEEAKSPSDLETVKTAIAQSPPCIREQAMATHKKLRSILGNSAGHLSSELAILLILSEDAAELNRRGEWALQYKQQELSIPVAAKEAV